jgi:hypothetical protein
MNALDRYLKLHEETAKKQIAYIKLSREDREAAYSALSPEIRSGPVHIETILESHEKLKGVLV